MDLLERDLRPLKPAGVPAGPDGRRIVLVALVGVLAALAGARVAFLALGGLDSGIAVILTYYGVLFVLALPFTLLRVRTLVPLTVAWVVVAPVVSHLVRPDLPIQLSPGIVPGLLLTLVMIGVLITGLNQAIRALFLSGDLDRLMVAPVHTRSVMVAKLLSRMPTNVLLLLLVAAPAFIASTVMGISP